LQTFHKVLTGCESGNGEAWLAFVREYTPLMIELGRVYLPGAGDPLSLWSAVLTDLCTDNFKILQTLAHQSEREFLADLRMAFLAKGRAALEPGDIPHDLTAPAKDSISSLLDGLPLVHQEIAFLKLAGYSDQTLERIFRITPAIAREGFQVLNQHYAAFLGRDKDECPWPGAWLTFLSGAWAGRTEACPTVRLFLRIQDGQIAWSEKEPAEAHLTRCLHCLEAWTALKEISYWRAAAPEVHCDSIKALISAVPGRKDTGRPASLLKRVLGHRGESVRNAT
jgi:hypothetical protein